MMEYKLYKRELCAAYLRHVLSVSGFNVCKAAKASGINRTDFYKACRRYGVVLRADAARSVKGLRLSAGANGAGIDFTPSRGRDGQHFPRTRR
jgi:hypothetical protein